MIALLRSEWTKLRTVRGWAIGAFVAALAMVGLGVLTAAGSHSSYDGGPGVGDVIGHPYVPLGPDGEAVIDNFYFAHQPLVGDGSITARLNDFTGLVGGPDGSPAPPRAAPGAPPPAPPPAPPAPPHRPAATSRPARATALAYSTRVWS